jgi:hypothetical protein
VAVDPSEGAKQVLAKVVARYHLERRPLRLV